MKQATTTLCLSRNLFKVALVALSIAGVKSYAQSYTPLNHPAFGPDVKIIACEPINYAGRDGPTFYWYALDLTNAKGWQMSSNEYSWSSEFEMEKTPNYLFLKQRFTKVRIDRKTLRTEHHGAVDSPCEFSSLRAINRKAAEDASTNSI